MHFWCYSVHVIEANWRLQLFNALCTWYDTKINWVTCLLYKYSNYLFGHWPHWGALITHIVHYDCIFVCITIVITNIWHQTAFVLSSPFPLKLYCHCKWYFFPIQICVFVQITPNECIHTSLFLFFSFPLYIYLKHVIRKWLITFIIYLISRLFCK